MLGASLMISQSFLYNAIFFTYTLVLGKFYGVASASAPLYLIAFAVGNLAGPADHRAFLRHHRPPEDDRRHLPAVRSSCWPSARSCSTPGCSTPSPRPSPGASSSIFASAGASAAYLTVSEIFPLEVRAKAIAVFFAIAQCFGALGPVIYGALIGDGSEPFLLFLGYLLGAAVMIAGGLVGWFLAVDAEGKSLEDIATPLSAAGERRRTGSVRAEGATRPHLP